jgi:hypothetical protein
MDFRIRRHTRRVLADTLSAARQPPSVLAKAARPFDPGRCRTFGGAALCGLTCRVPGSTLDRGALEGGAVSTVYEMFASSDEQEITALVREVDELRRSRGLQQLSPWWQIQRSGLFGPRWLGRTQRRVRCLEDGRVTTP